MVPSTATSHQPRSLCASATKLSMSRSLTFNSTLTALLTRSIGTSGSRDKVIRASLSSCTHQVEHSGSLASISSPTTTPSSITPTTALASLSLNWLAVNHPDHSCNGLCKPKEPINSTSTSLPLTMSLPVQLRQTLSKLANSTVPGLLSYWSLYPCITASLSKPSKPKRPSKTES